MSLSPDALATLLAQPALAPPDGVTPNFENPSNGNHLAYVVTTFCSAVTTICLFLRLFAKGWLEKKIRVEEILMIGAYGAYWGTAYAGYALIDTPGYYVHTWNLHNKDLIRPLYLILVYGCCYSTVLPLIKTAILLDWIRIFVPIDRTRNVFWWGCISVITLQSLWGILCILLLNMQCRPHSAIWLFYLPAKCYSLPKVMLVSASVQVASDIIMCFLPQRIIWNLQMNWQKKAGVSVIFGVGVLASVAACFRLAHTVAFANTTDTMYLIGPLLFWACGEMTCAFFIFSVPCLSKLIVESGLPRRVKTSLGFGSGGTSGPSYENSGNPAHRSGTFNSRKASRSNSHPMKTWERIQESSGNGNGKPGRSESQTSLQGASGIRTGGRVDPNKSVHVSHTVEVSVSDSHSQASEGSDRDHPGRWHGL